MENVRGRGIFAARVAKQHYRSIHLRAELGAALRINIVRLARARLSRGRGEENQHEENRENRRAQILCAPAPMSYRHSRASLRTRTHRRAAPPPAACVRPE